MRSTFGVTIVLISIENLRKLHGVHAACPFQPILCSTLQEGDDLTKLTVLGAAAAAAAALPRPPAASGAGAFRWRLDASTAGLTNKHSQQASADFDALKNESTSLHVPVRFAWKISDRSGRGPLKSTHMHELAVSTSSTTVPGRERA